MRYAIIICTIIIALVVAGCTPPAPEPKQFEQVDVGLSWIHESQFAGVYAADQLGYFEEEGLKVTFHPFNYEDLAQELVNGKYDFIYLQTDSLFEARDEGLAVKAVFADYRIIPTVYFSKKDSDILKPEDLKGKTVGVAYSERYPLEAMLKNAAIPLDDVNIVEREYNYDKLASGEFDVEAGWVTDGDTVQEVVGDYNQLSPYKYGVNWYADLLTTTENNIDQNPELVERFLRATVKGWQYAIENQDEAALFTQKYDPEMQSEHLRFVLRVSSPLIHTGDQYIGWMEQEDLQNAYDLLVEQGVIKSQLIVNDAFTNEYLEQIYVR